jgi:hypothetical protein
MKIKSLLAAIGLLLLLPVTASHAQFGNLLDKIKGAADTIEKGIRNSPIPLPKGTPETGTPDSLPGRAAAAVNAYQDESRGKLYFSSRPFTGENDTANATNTFAAGQEIYGMVVMDKNFGEYNDDDSKPINVVFYANLINMAGRGSSANTALQANIHPKFNKQKHLSFDVSPAPAKAATYAEHRFMRLGNLFATIKGNETYGDRPKLGNKRSYEIEFKIGSKTYAKSVIEVDYTNATKETMNTWMAREEEAFKMAQSNTTKANDGEAANAASGLPLPKSFLQPSTGGYSDPRLNAANITAMVKKSEAVKDVLQFMFVKTTAQSDFELYKTNLGLPDYQWGNRFFQFIFKDASGKCLAAGGRIRMNYEGGGKFGAPYVIWELPDVSPTEGYFKDTELKAFVVDCNKVRR